MLMCQCIEVFYINETYQLKLKLKKLSVTCYEVADVPAIGPFQNNEESSFNEGQ